MRTHAVPRDAETASEVTGQTPQVSDSQPSTLNPQPSPGRRTTRIAMALEQVPRMGRVARVVDAEWAPGLLIFFCDILCWLGLYGSLASLRHDASFSSGLELAVIDGLQLLVVISCLFIIGGYSSRTEMRGLAYTAEHIIAMIAALAVSGLAIYAAAAFDHVMRPSRAAVLVSFVAFTPLSLLYRRMLSGRVAKASANRAFLVIGAGQIAANFYKTYRESPNQQRLEFVDVERQRVGQPIAGPGSPLVEGDLSSKLTQASRRYSGIILAEGIGQIGPDVLDRLIRTQFQRTRVYTLESFYEVHWKRVPIHSVDPFWPLQTGFQQLARTSPYHYVKRIFDIVASGALLVICSPLMVLIGLLIRLTNGRPVIFKQLRVGRDETLFTMYKFRTMQAAPVPDGTGGRTTGLQDHGTIGPQAGEEQSAKGEEQNGTTGLQDYRTTGPEEQGAGSEEQGAESKGQSAESPPTSRLRRDSSAGEQGDQLSTLHSQPSTSSDDLYTRPNDPRVSRLGRWLRKLRLDELPQLWNVLKGQLSLIGPRAEWVECADRYRKKIPFYHFRHLVKPGITGWAQVNYPYGESDEDAVEKLKYDLYYIRHYSLTLDAMIVLKTVYTMLFGKGR
jgi:lipopolysaccharide/colanic/teichoic acid biosynthesis glycosyltransferase